MRRLNQLADEIERNSIARHQGGIVYGVLSNPFVDRNKVEQLALAQKASAKKRVRK
jgi:hypothetical protein